MCIHIDFLRANTHRLGVHGGGHLHLALGDLACLHVDDFVFTDVREHVARGVLRLSKGLRGNAGHRQREGESGGEQSGFGK